MIFWVIEIYYGLDDVFWVWESLIGDCWTFSIKKGFYFGQVFFGRFLTLECQNKVAKYLIFEHFCVENGVKKECQKQHCSLEVILKP